MMGFHASEVAEMLEGTVGSVNSALKRARASLQRRQQPAAGRQPPPAAGSPPEDVIVARLARAWESADLDALVALLTDDVFIAMPPEPFGYEGRDLVARYWALTAPSEVVRRGHVNGVGGCAERWLARPHRACASSRLAAHRRP